MPQLGRQIELSVLCWLTITYVWRIEQCALCRYGALVLAGEALGACSVVLYGLCIIRRALPAPAPGMQAATDGADQAFHVQARTRKHNEHIYPITLTNAYWWGHAAVSHLMPWNAALSCVAPLWQ